MEEISKLQKEALLIQEIPQKLSESLANCKAINEDIFSTFQVQCITHVLLSYMNPDVELLEESNQLVNFLLTCTEFCS